MIRIEICEWKTGDKLFKQKRKAIAGIFHNKGFRTAIMILASKCIYYIFLYPVIILLKKINFKKKQNRLIIQSSLGMTDNARALYDYLLEHHYNDKYQIIWLINNTDQNRKAANVKFVKETYRYAGCRTLLAYYYARTARIILFTHAFQWIGRFDRDQVFINLWHGCGYKAKKGRGDISFDYCLVPGDLFIDTKAEFFSCKREKILPLGYPRYDWLLNTSICKKQILDKLGWSPGKKIVFWMPTFRRCESVWLNEDTLTGELGLPIIQNQQELFWLDQLCSELLIILVIKQHHLQKDYRLNKEALKAISFISDGILAYHNLELYQILPHTDALITDYSSVAIDYLLLDKPIGFTLDDFNQYQHSRGFVFDEPRTYMPGKHIYDRDDLEEYLRCIKEDMDPYQQDRAKIRQMAHNKLDAGFCKNIVEYFNF